MVERLPLGPATASESAVPEAVFALEVKEEAEDSTVDDAPHDGDTDREGCRTLASGQEHVIKHALGDDDCDGDVSEPERVEVLPPKQVFSEIPLRRVVEDRLASAFLFISDELWIDFLFCV